MKFLYRRSYFGVFDYETPWCCGLLAGAEEASAPFDTWGLVEGAAILCLWRGVSPLCCPSDTTGGSRGCWPCCGLRLAHLVSLEFGEADQERPSGGLHEGFSTGAKFQGVG